MPYELAIDGNLFADETVMAVLNRLASKIAVEDLKKCENGFLLKFSLKDDLPVDKIKSEINQRLIEQRLKDTVYERTKDIRTLILANAFSKTSLIDY